MRRALGTLAAVCCTVALMPSAAQATIYYTEQWSDARGDAPAAADIVEVTAQAQHSVRADVVDLRSSGTLRVTFDDSGDRYVFIVTKRTGHAPQTTTRAYSPDGTSYHSLWCDPHVIWDSAHDYVRLSYDWGPCLDILGEDMPPGPSVVRLSAAGTTDTVRTPDEPGMMLGSQTYDDRHGDAAPRADLWRTTVTATSGAWWGRSHVADLRGAGRWRMFLSDAEDTDQLRVVVLKQAGTAPVASLFKQSVDYSTGELTPWRRVPCSMVVAWDATDDYLKVQVPRRCDSALNDVYLHPYRFDMTAEGATDVLVPS